LTRLAGLSDDAFSATEDAFDRMIKADAEKAKKDGGKPENNAGKKQAKADDEKNDPPMRSDAGVRPGTWTTGRKVSKTSSKAASWPLITNAWV